MFSNQYTNPSVFNSTICNAKNFYGKAQIYEISKQNNSPVTFVGLYLSEKNGKKITDYCFNSSCDMSLAL